MKKRLITLSLVLCVTFSLVVPVGATGVEDEQAMLQSVEISSANVVFENEELEKIGVASVKDSVIINGVTNYLYPTFDDLDSALLELEAAIPNYYSFVVENIDLVEVYNYSYDELLNAGIQVDIDQVVTDEMREISGATSVASQADVQKIASELETELEEEKMVFDLFFDIYENKAKNEAIKDYLESTSAPDPEVLAYMLPYTSPFVVEYFETVEPSAAAAQYFNRTLGIEYATKWATGANSGYPYYAGQGDCTNFASQILIAGGIQMHDKYPDKTSGWWHRIIGTVNPGTHVVSLSWSVADNFVRFMGTSNNQYSSFRTLSEKLIAGDFIAYNRGRDDDWDHVGFVTETGSFGTYQYTNSGVTYSKYYKNFRVAQHTTNYHEWVSSDKNGWEKLEDEGGVIFAIVRRNYTIG